MIWKFIPRLIKIYIILGSFIISFPLNQFWLNFQINRLLSSKSVYVPSGLFYSRILRCLNQFTYIPIDLCPNQRPNVYKNSIISYLQKGHDVFDLHFGWEMCCNRVFPCLLLEALWRRREALTKLVLWMLPGVAPTLRRERSVDRRNGSSTVLLVVWPDHFWKMLEFF